ncbi:MAG: hypothetical protein B7Z15_03505 [Rhizobiales bacterium 32-66-8]|nr:MAG: hypothetical protein B7Z15_03505 [Rhizobiales bacterium 32-66-8]
MTCASRSATLAAAVFGLVLATYQPASAQTTSTLELSQGKVITDPAGAFITVQVKNAGAKAVDKIVVGCEFFAGKKSLGTSSTTLFGTVPGVTGSDQVRLIGATSAKTATCAVTSPTN